MAKEVLKHWVLDAVRAHQGSARPIEVARYIWQEHEADLRDAGDLFYSWQYDMRWAAQVLRDEGILAKKHGQRSGTWDLA